MREYLRNTRKNSEKTMKQIAEELHISESYYSLIENGERQIDMNLSVIRNLAKVFNISIFTIIEEERKYQEIKQDNQKALDKAQES